MPSLATHRAGRYTLAAASVIAIAAASVVGSTAPAYANSGNWSVTELPDLGENGSADNIDAVATDDVWAIGNKGPKGGKTGLAVHYDGNEWSTVDTPEGVRLSGVKMLDEDSGMIVGGSDEGAQSLVWDGKSWNQQPAVVPDGGEGWLNTVDGVAVDDMWATGNAGIVGLPDGQGFLEHWDGERWTMAEIGGLGDLSVFSLEAITTLSADDAWAVGTADGESGSKPLALHWDGTEWTMQGSGDQTGSLTGVTALDGEVWAAGFADPDNSPFGGAPLLMRWDSEQWIAVVTPTDAGWLYGLDVDGEGGLIATGYTDQNSAMIMRWDGEAVTTEPGPAEGDTMARGIANVPGTTTTWVLGMTEMYEPFAAYIS